MRQGHFSLLRQALAATDGAEVKNLGDGIMAVFASSSAAIACAVAMQQGVEEDNRQAADALGLRVGLSGGEVTVEDDDYFGDPVVEAARVCALCNGGQIVITDAVRFMVGRRSSHPLTPLGDRELKGLPDPVALFAVSWTPATTAVAGVPLPDRLETASSAASFGFFGREREQALLVDAVKHAAEGSRQVAFLSGEPGIGKTSLCRQVAQRAFELDLCVLYGRCDEDVNVAYQPFAEALSHLVIHADESMLAEHVTAHGGVLVGLVPALSTRLPGLPAVQSADPDTERARLFSAVVGLLASASRDAGLLLVVDDLHWADQATLHLLRHVARSNQLEHVTILGTYRDSELSAGNALSDMLASLRREADVQRIDLVGFDDVEVIEMMEGAAGHEMPEDGVALAHAVRRETEGNPFFTTEMLVHLGEAGLVRQDDTGHWVATDDLYKQGLPQSVREVVGQRVDRLGEDARRVLSPAAVIGRDFDLELLAIVADLDEDRVLDVLDQASAAGLVTEVEGTVDRYSFAHALTQHTLYDDLGASRRARAHRKIAEALETLCGTSPEARSGELARHFVAATKTADARKALTYSQMAGNHALAQLAPADALGWFTQALDLYSQTAPDEALHCDLLIGLGTAQRQTGDPTHRDTLLQAAAIAKDLGDANRLVHAALANNRGAMSEAGEVDTERVAGLEDALTAVGDNDSADKALILAILCAELAYSDERERVSRLATEALAMVRRLDDPIAFLRVANVVYTAVAVPDNLDDRLSDLADAAATAANIGDLTAGVHAHGSRAVACLQAGNRMGFDEHVDACAVIADQLDQRYERWDATYKRAVRCLLSGDLDAAEELADAALEIGADSVPEALAVWGAQVYALRAAQGRLAEIVDMFAQAADDNPGLPVLRAALAHIYSELERPHEALAIIDADIADHFAQFPYDVSWLPGMVLLSNVCARSGQHHAAQALYARLLPWHAQVPCSGPTTDGPVALHLGVLATTLQEYDDAERHFAEALDISNNLSAPYWVARTQLEWAELLRRRAEPDDAPHAKTLLTAALEAARTYGFGALEARTTALLSPG